MGTSNMQDLGGLAALDTNAFAVVSPDCLGAAHSVQPPGVFGQWIHGGEV
jgi:hypothetical protein